MDFSSRAAGFLESGIKFERSEKVQQHLQTLGLNCRRKSKKISIPDIIVDIIYTIFECGYQIPVAKICNEGRKSNKP